MLISINTYGWITSSNSIIVEIVQWEANVHGSPYAVMRLSDNTQCYVPLAEKELYALMLSLFMSGRQFSVHCYDEAIDIGGYAVHKLHRVNGFKK